MPHIKLTRVARQWRWVMGLVFLLAMVFLVALAMQPGTILSFDSEQTRDFSDGWSLLGADGSQTPLTLPTKIETDGAVRLQKTVPEDVPYPAVVGFRSAHQKVRLYCDGQLLYSFGYENEALFGKSPGSAWNLVRLPWDCAGKQLMLEMESPYASYRGRVETMQMGSKAAQLFFMLRENFFSLLLTAIIFLSGLAMLLIYGLILRKDGGVGKETLFLGLFSLFVSLWLFGEGRLIQFFGISPAFNTCFTLLSMLATPIPLTFYIGSASSLRNRKLLGHTAKALTILVAVCLGLQAFGVLDFIEQLPYIHIILVGTCVILLYVVISDAVRQPNAAAYRLLISLGILAICFALETVGLYLGNRPIGGMMRLGVFLFIAIQALAAFQDATRVMLMSRFASVDALTGCQNRAAYSQWLEELTGEKSAGVVIADINDLKFINDTYGHEVGDEAIIRCARCFNDAFSPGGRCFRIGGDEFAMLGSHLTLERLRDRADTFAALGRDHAKQTTYPFSVSCGFAVFDADQDQTLTDTVNRADQMMYQNKRRAKQGAGK